MSVSLFLLLIFGLVVLAVAVPSVVAYAGNGDKREALRTARAERDTAKARERIATKALRSIANGAGAPVLEAQDALEQIEHTYTKEIA